MTDQEMRIAAARIDRIEAVRNQFGGRCGYCGIRFGREYYSKFSIDHVKPRSCGGKSKLKNLLASCRNCNGLKSAMSVEQFRAAIIAGGVEQSGIDTRWLRLIELFSACGPIFYYEQQHASYVREKGAP